MPEVICNTSPLQYLHQLDLLDVLQAFTDHIIVPPAVVHELAAGRAQGVNLPDPSALQWETVRQPVSTPVLPLVTDLGPGEICSPRPGSGISRCGGDPRRCLGTASGSSAPHSISWDAWLAPRCQTCRPGVNHSPASGSTKRYGSASTCAPAKRFSPWQVKRRKRFWRKIASHALWASGARSTIRRKMCSVMTGVGKGSRNAASR